MRAGSWLLVGALLLAPIVRAAEPLQAPCFPAEMPAGATGWPVLFGGTSLALVGSDDDAEVRTVVVVRYQRGGLTVVVAWVEGVPGVVETVHPDGRRVRMIDPGVVSKDGTLAKAGKPTCGWVPWEAQGA